jgi:hypothetical protein
VATLKPGLLMPLLDAEATRTRGRLAAYRDDPETAEPWFRRAIDLFRELATPFHRARAQLEYAELLAGIGRPLEEVSKQREEAAATFAQLGAEPWLERADTLGSQVAA